LFQSKPSFLTREDGASLIEYSLLIGLISVSIVVSIASISGSLAPVWSNLASMVAQVAG
jgi:Flp pilus assembly pilin Flp